MPTQSNLIKAVASAYLQSFTGVAATNKYSPTAVAIAYQCRLAFRAPDGGIYPVAAQDILTAAKELGIARNASTGKVGISAEQFNARLDCSVFSPDLICVHGFAPYTFELDAITRQPKRVCCCPRCPGGYLAPSSEQVAQAKLWLTNRPKNGTAPGAGALVIAARELGLSTSKPINATFQIRRH